MTTDQINVAIAESMGWADFGYMDIGLGPKLTATIYPDQEVFGVREVPNYCNDLNACADFERTLTGASNGLPLTGETRRYADELLTVCLIERPATYIVCATALQRCEAYLRVKNLWPAT